METIHHINSIFDLAERHTAHLYLQVKESSQPQSTRRLSFVDLNRVFLSFSLSLSLHRIFSHAWLAFCWIHASPILTIRWGQCLLSALFQPHIGSLFSLYTAVYFAGPFLFCIRRSVYACLVIIFSLAHFTLIPPKTNTHPHAVYAGAFRIRAISEHQCLFGFFFLPSPCLSHSLSLFQCVFLHHAQAMFIQKFVSFSWYISCT